MNGVKYKIVYDLRREILERNQDLIDWFVREYLYLNDNPCIEIIYITILTLV